VDIGSRGIEFPFVGAIGTPDYVAPEQAGIEAERQELDWLLTSGVLGRSGNLARVLTYICAERFAGRAQQIKEYTIATQALGRRPDFDPNSDTIVRVTVHSLRKRLLEVYQNEGADRPMRLVLPPGHYDPCFVSVSRMDLPQPSVPVRESTLPDRDDDRTHVVPHEITPSRPQVSARPVLRLSTGTIALTLAVAAALAWGILHRQAGRSRPADSLSAAAAMPLPLPQATIRALLGSGRQPYVDHSGITWGTGNYCRGGATVAVPPQRIEGTEDAPIYFGGVRGMAHCVFPVTQKLYELHFHFAETSDLPAATRVALLSINGRPDIRIDVVSAAGGDGIATSAVVTGVIPENDGAIHIDFTSEVSLLNAVEILPAPSADLLPVRIVTGSRPFVDSANQTWLSDRYFSGGRHGLLHDAAKQEDLGLYEGNRIGRFRYTIPVVPRAHYRVRLYFRESWFGNENGGFGGPGSRVFDVACNGELLMKNFDILATSGSAPVVKTFDNIQARTDGTIELSFLPVVNYAVLNAIEVLPEN
jgi:hypothetical protein